MASPSLIGRYQVLELLGEGGMAEVYLALDPAIKRQVAIKLLNPQLSHNERTRQRFRSEAEMIATLEHPFIVPIYDYSVTETGRPFIVMRYLPNGTLEQRIDRGPMPLQDSNIILQRLCQALFEAHERGIIHRDLKPSNVLFDHRGSAFLADFGIAKLLEGSGQQTSGIIGTPAYMSPEQAKGMEIIDGRSDIYALGILVFEMLTGRQPYEADTPMAVALKHITEPPPLINDIMPDLPAGLEPIIVKMMAKEPEDRYTNTLDVARAFDEVTRSTTQPTFSGFQSLRPSPPTTMGGQPLSEKDAPPAELEPAPEETDATVTTSGPIGARDLLTTKPHTAADLDPSVDGVLEAHEAPVLAVATNPSNNLWASGGADQRVFVWDGQSLQQLHELRAHRSAVRALAFHPNGELLASAGDDHHIALWHPISGNLLHSIANVPLTINAMAFSPDGALLAVAGEDNSVYVYDPHTRELRFELKGHRDHILGLTFSPDGKLLASAGHGQRLYLWNVADGQPMRALSGRGGAMWTSVFIGNFLLTGSHTGLIQYWDLSSGRCLKTMHGPASGVMTLTLLPNTDETHFLTTGTDSTIREWNLNTGRLQHRYLGHEGAVRSVALSRTGNRFISGSDDTTVRVWSIKE